MVEVRYFSKSGNTKAVADVIAAEAGVKAGSVGGADAVRADILFLGRFSAVRCMREALQAS